jgi:hypothetical protein
MIHYGFSKKFFKKQDKPTLIDWGKKLNGILLSIESHSLYWDKDDCEDKIEEMTKMELVEYCYDTVDDILNSDIGKYSTFFWSDGGSDNSYEYLYETINEKGKLVDDFVKSDYLESFWKKEIQGYKLGIIWTQLADDYPDFYSERLTDEQILLEWKKYKLRYKTVELFD